MSWEWVAIDMTNDVLPSWPDFDTKDWILLESLDIREFDPFLNLPGSNAQGVKIYLVKWRGYSQDFMVLASFPNLQRFESLPLRHDSEPCHSLGAARNTAQQYLGIFGWMQNGDLVVNLDRDTVVPLDGAWRKYARKTG